MAYGTGTNFSIAGVQAVAPSGLCSHYAEMIAPGGLSAADASGNPVNPEVDITRATSLVVARAGQAVGTVLKIRVRYINAISAITGSVVVRMFGRYRDSAGVLGSWRTLRTYGGSTTSTIAFSPSTDDGDGTYKWSVPDRTANLFDTDGCNEFLAGLVSVPSAVTGGALTDLRLEGLLL